MRGANVLLEKTPGFRTMNNTGRPAAPPGRDSPARDGSDALGSGGLFPSGLVVTIDGESAIDAVFPGDIVLVVGRVGYSPIQRMNEVTVDLSVRPDAAPILIRRGALDIGSPLRDTILAPHTLIGLDERLVPVVALVNGRSIVRAPHTGRIRYLQVEMCVHEMIIVDGIRVATEAQADVPCRPVIGPGADLDRIRARIAARIGQPDGGAGTALPGPRRRGLGGPF